MSSSMLPAPDCCSSGGAASTVLVVEDDPIVRQAVQMLLEDHGFSVLTANDGIEGLQQFREHKPDVVLTDIIMPEKEGVALIMELRREAKDAKIIAMSGSGRIGNTDYVRIATALGADAGLHKPFDDLELIETVQTLLARAPEVNGQASAA